MDVGPEKRTHPKSAPFTATFALKSRGKSRELQGESPENLISHGIDEGRTENDDFQTPKHSTWSEANSNPTFSAFPRPLDDDGSAAADLSHDHTLQPSPLNETSLDHPLDTFPEVVLPVNREDIPTPCVATNAIPSHLSSNSTVHHIVHKPAVDDVKPPFVWPLAEKEVQLVKHFFTVLVSWVRYHGFHAYISSSICPFVCPILLLTYCSLIIVYQTCIFDLFLGPQYSMIPPFCLPCLPFQPGIAS